MFGMLSVLMYRLVQCKQKVTLQEKKTRLFACENHSCRNHNMPVNSMSTPHAFAENATPSQTLTRLSGTSWSNYKAVTNTPIATIAPNL